MYILSPMRIVLCHRRLYMSEGCEMYILSPMRIVLCHRRLYMSEGCEMYILSPTRYLVLQTAPFFIQPCNVYIFVHTQPPAQTIRVRLPFLMNCYKNSTPVTVSSYCQQPQYYQPYKTVNSLMSPTYLCF